MKNNKKRRLPTLNDGDVMISWGENGNTYTRMVKGLKKLSEFKTLVKSAEISIFQLSTPHEEKDSILIS